jgi:hypothetical protein
MRYLEVSIHQPPDERNPMHQFVVDHEDYGVARLLNRYQYREGEHAMLFHVEGPEKPYGEVLAGQPFVEEYELSACPDESFYLYVRGTLTADEQEFAGAFAQPGLVVVMPVEFRPDGTVRVTAVGPAGTVQAAVDAVPGTMGVDVRTVGEYFAGRLDARLELTGRQMEAVAEAVESGYYETPRSSTLDDVAARLDCSSGTAGELLRRAERTVMANLVEGRAF